MKTKSLTAAQIDILAQHLSDAPITPSASAKKAGDNLARLLVAGIGEERAAITFTSIMSADAFEQAEARLILVLKYGKNEPVNLVIEGVARAPADQPVAPTALTIGKRQAILDQAQAGALPQPPDFSKPTHARFRAKLAQIVALAEASDIAGLLAFEINPISSSPKAMARYRELAIISIKARLSKT